MLILRLFRLFALVLLTLFSVVMLIIRVQPYDDRDLQGLLKPEGCTAPCFMGIRPGVTRGDAAVAILQSSAWVEADSIYISPDITRNFIWVTWRWSEDKPDYLWATGFMTYSPNRDGTVNFIQIHTTLLTGSMRLALGQPQEDSTLRTEHVAVYSGEGLFLQNLTRCGLSWREAVNLYFVAPGRFDEVRSQLGLITTSGAQTHPWPFCPFKAE